MLLPEFSVEGNAYEETIVKEESQLISKNIKEKEENFDTFLNLLKQNFEKNPGELIMVVGKIGSGKSRLLLNFIDEEETVLTQSYLNCNKIAYYCENP